MRKKERWAELLVAVSLIGIGIIIFLVVLKPDLLAGDLLETGFLVTLVVIFLVTLKNYSHGRNLEEMLEKTTLELDELKEKLSCQARERKEMESRFLTVQKLESIGTLSRGATHEFNNIFMAITGYVSLIQKYTEQGHPNIEKTEKIIELVARGSQSIQQFLGFARIGKYALGPLSLNVILHQNLDIFGRSRKTLEIRPLYFQDLWSVQADRSQMEQVIMNLLLNASDAMPEKGCLRVETRNVVLDKKPVGPGKVVSGQFVLFRIEDEGVGIDEEILPRVFDPFFPTKPEGTGTGMGLFSVFGISDNHGGGVTVDSKTGEGSVFCFYLPAIPDKSNINE
jgi:two-component system cell cycle sensor histidine kinase/response regulator CckA